MTGLQPSHALQIQQLNPSHQPAIRLAEPSVNTKMLSVDPHDGSQKAQYQIVITDNFMNYQV